MPIDNSIYFQQQAPDILGSLQRGLSMRGQLNEMRDKSRMRADDEALRNAAKGAVVTDENGVTSLDQAKYLSDLGKINPLKAYEQKQAWSADQRQNELADLDLNSKKATAFGSMMGGIVDQPSYTRVRNQALKMDLIGEQTWPEVYDPKIVESTWAQTLSMKDRFDQQLKERTAGQRDRELDIKEKEVAAKRAEAGRTGAALPLEKKKFVETLATKNAGKVAIKNQIDSVLANWDSLPDDQKVAAGRQLIKTLNSTEGADAVGVEEARRLGGKLEYAMGNLFNSNPVQFGRDLEGFKTQAENVSKAIGSAVTANDAEIDKAYGRKSAAPPPGGVKVIVTNGKETLQIDASDLKDAQKDGFQLVNQ